MERPLCLLLLLLSLFSLYANGFREPDAPLPQQEAVAPDDLANVGEGKHENDNFRDGHHSVESTLKDPDYESSDTLIPPVVPMISNVTQAVLGADFNVTKEMLPQQDVGYENKDVHPMFTYTLKIFGPFFFIALQCASVLVALDVWKARNTYNLSPLPFLSQLVNCIVWGIYGLLRRDVTIFWPNFVGFWAGLFTVVIFHRFCKAKPIIYYGIFSLPFLLCIEFSRENNDFKVGVLGCTLAVIVSGAPLATIKTVIREKSTAALPLLPSVFTWMNAFCWFLYGYLIVDDIMIYGPNSMGLLLSSIQMFLYIMYGFPPPYSQLPHTNSKMYYNSSYEPNGVNNDGDSSESLLVKSRKLQEQSTGSLNNLYQIER